MNLFRWPICETQVPNPNSPFLAYLFFLSYLFIITIDVGFNNTWQRFYIQTSNHAHTIIHKHTIYYYIDAGVTFHALYLWSLTYRKPCNVTTREEVSADRATVALTHRLHRKWQIYHQLKWVNGSLKKIIHKWIKQIIN